MSSLRENHSNFAKNNATIFLRVQTIIRVFNEDERFSFRQYDYGRRTVTSKYNNFAIKSTNENFLSIYVIKEPVELWSHLSGSL